MARVATVSPLITLTEFTRSRASRPPWTTISAKAPLRAGPLLQCTGRMTRSTTAILSGRGCRSSSPAFPHSLVQAKSSSPHAPRLSALTACASHARGPPPACGAPPVQRSKKPRVPPHSLASDAINGPRARSRHLQSKMHRRRSAQYPRQFFLTDAAVIVSLRTKFRRYRSGSRSPAALVTRSTFRLYCSTCNDRFLFAHAPPFLPFIPHPWCHLCPLAARASRNTIPQPPTRGLGSILDSTTTVPGASYSPVPSSRCVHPLLPQDDHLSPHRGLCLKPAPIPLHLRPIFHARPPLSLSAPPPLRFSPPRPQATLRVATIFRLQIALKLCFPCALGIESLSSTRALGTHPPERTSASDSIARRSSAPRIIRTFSFRLYFCAGFKSSFSIALWIYVLIR
ncbi:hypothetical protein B0H13DRAFT_2319380 [Mycena leptocephala]|nr:hypothetical protein B0H13DRAFT_2319380 [Mycena leptocephala]